MAILEKEVEVNVACKNKTYYKNKGYKVPESLRRNTKIKIKINDLQEGSSVLITKICDVCGSVTENQRFSQTLKLRKKSNGKDICFQCAIKENAKNRKELVVYEKSLQHYAEINDKSHLIYEFDSVNKKKPHEISKGSASKYWWNCFECDSKYEASVNSRTTGTGCPFCRSLKVNYSNCLNKTHPNIASLLKNYKDGYTVTYGSTKRLDFSCPRCKKTHHKKVNDITSKGFSCSSCGDGISYPEKIMASILQQLKINYEKEKIFKWSGNKKYDFFLPDHGCIIETHGSQHYNGGFESVGGRNLFGEKSNDELKRKLANENGVRTYIELDCSESEINYIKKSIEKSDLYAMLNLEDVDWHLCEKHAATSVLIEVCKLYDDKHSISQISKLLSVGITSIYRYLKKGEKLGLCVYEPKKPKRKIVQLSLESVLLNEFQSIMEASRVMGIPGSNINACCRGKAKTSGGYKWMYKEDYDEYIEEKNNKEIV